MRSQFRNLIVITVLAAAIAPAAVAQDCEPNWDNAIGQPGLNNPVFALTVFDDGEGPALYAGTGAFGVGGVWKWDGTSWLLVSPILNGPVHSLTVFDDGGGPALYAGGWFVGFGMPGDWIAKWDGSSWSPVGEEVDGPVYAMTVFDQGGDPALYVGSGGFPTSHIRRWDGTSWSLVGSGMTGGDVTVRALAVLDDGSGPKLYAGGGFTSAGGAPASFIASWDGKSWSPLGSGTEHFVLALTPFDSGDGEALYVGGFFSHAGAVPGTEGIAKWDGASWSALGTGVSHMVNALAVFDDGTGGGDALYAGGAFTTAGGDSANRVAKWDGTSWSPLDSGVNDQVRALAGFGGEPGGGSALYVGGDFTSAGGADATFVAGWQALRLRGACCLNGVAIQTFAEECAAVGGVFHGEGVPSDAVKCDPTCASDLNADGQVDVLDLLQLLGAWGACP